MYARAGQRFWGRPKDLGRDARSASPTDRVKKKKNGAKIKRPHITVTGVLGLVGEGEGEGVGAGAGMGPCDRLDRLQWGPGLGTRDSGLESPCRRILPISVCCDGPREEEEEEEKPAERGRPRSFNSWALGVVPNYPSAGSRPTRTVGRWKRANSHDSFLFVHRPDFSVS